MKKFSLAWVACLWATAFSLFADSTNFVTKTLIGVDVNNPTSIDIGPDGRVYLSTQEGLIYAYAVERSVEGDYSVTDTEVIDIIQTIPNHDDDGALSVSVNTRQVTGIMVKGTASNPVIYVSSSDPRIGGGASRGDLNLDTNSGTLSRLIWDGVEWLKVDLVRGLPRSEENHANNGMDLDESTNMLYLTVGGFTNAGSPSNNFAFISEYAYSACIVRVDLDALDLLPIQTSGDTHFVYDLPTVDDPTRSNVNGITNPNDPGYVGDINDPFGGNDGLNMAKLDVSSPVQIFSSGFRNVYDVVITEAGNIYTWDNGANRSWGGHPENEGGGNATNNYVTGELGSRGPGPNDAQVNNLDGLHFVGNLSDANRTYYGGHPNPIRAHPNGAGLYTDDTNIAGAGVFRTAVTNNPATSLPIDWPPVPPSLADTREGDYQNPGVDDLSIFTVGSSTNGITEYRSNSFGGELKGDLLAAAHSGAIYRVNLNDSGTIDSSADVTVFANGFGSTPLDVIAQDDTEFFPGTIWTATYGADTVVIFEPGDAPNCTGIDSFLLDDDNDGFSNADEIDSGTNPCNNADRPFDVDGDLISDVNDSDDDNDGIPDTVDLFPLDPFDGVTTVGAFTYELLNGDPGTGFYGLGFTGLMHDGSSDYLDLIADENNSSTEIIAGGASGLFTVNQVASGTSRGGANSLKNGFQFGVNVMETTPAFTVKSNLLSPVVNDGASEIGLFIGTGSQDDYVSLTVNESGFAVTQETNGVPSTQQLNVASANDMSEAILQLTVDPSAGTVQPSVSVDGGTVSMIGNPLVITGELLSSLQLEPALAIGLTAENSSGVTDLSATWDSISMTYDNAAGCEGVWTSVDTPNGAIDARHEADYLKVAGKFYLIGGRGNKELNIYDPETGIWTNGTRPPIQFHHFQGLVYQDELWVVGAFEGGFPDETPVDNIWIYNPINDAWREGPTIPRPRGGGGVVTYDGKIYLVSGLTNGHIGGHVTWLDCYDPATDTWSQLPDAPRARDHFRAVVVGDRIYNAAGRRTARNSSEGVFGNLEARVDYYDISMGQWFTLPVGSNIPTPRAGNAAINFQDKVLVIGGESLAQTTAHAEVELLDPTTEAWSTLPSLLQGRHGSGVIEYNGDLYIASGSGGRGGGPELTTHEKYCGCSSHNFNPILSVDESDTWAQVTSGQVEDLMIEITNTSNFDLSIGSIRSDSDLFTITNEASIPSVLAAGESFVIEVLFDPGEGGIETFTAQLTIVTNAPDSPVTVVNLTGERFLQPGQLQTVLAINVAGDEFTAQDGTVYEADRGFVGGREGSTTDNIAGTADDGLYRSERFDDFSYSFPVENGQYELTLKFAEIFFSDAGRRVFDVEVEDLLVIDSLDIFSEVGHDSAFDVTIPVTVSDGQLDLEMINGSANLAKLSAFKLALIATDSMGLVATEPTVMEAQFGGSDNAMISVTNTAGSDITIQSLTTTGAFEVLTQVPLVIPAGEEAFIEVAFSPTMEGPANFEGLLTLGNSFIGNSSFTVDLVGIRLATSLLGVFETSQDIGSVSAAGSASYEVSSDEYIVMGSGRNIWDADDEFRFVYRQLTGDGTIIARVTSFDADEAWSKAGVMIRESLDVGSPHALMLVSGANINAFQRRVTADANSLHTSGSSGALPQWVRLVREGNVFTASESSDANTWVEVGSQTIEMSDQVYFGLAVTSRDDGTIATAIFDNVSIPLDFDGDGISNENDADDDNDSLPDVVEIRLGLNPFSADSDEDGVLDQNEDSDGDGYSNIQEHLVTFTDPGDSGSRFSLSFTEDSLSFPVHPGNTYNVLYSDDMISWAPHGESPITPSEEGVRTLNFSDDGAQLFFKLEIVSEVE